MEKQMTLTMNMSLYKRIGDAARRLTEAYKTLFRRAAYPMHLLRRYYSYVLEREVTMREARLLTEVQAAAFLFIFPVECPVIVRMAALLWAFVALKKCKNLPPAGRE